MCGICGVVGVGSKETGETLVRRMMAAMFHRGPDEEGILLAPPVAAGMRRLSIIDLAGGSQPVWNEDETVAVLYNGEIYNFTSVREELQARGHRFRTRSDTEVIVHAYEEWGERSVERLLGMFAFAIVEMPHGRNGRAARVFLARDRLGIKPLYYGLIDGVLVFSSEVRSLVASGLVPARLSTETLPAYLLFGSVCEPDTLIDRVHSLPPGHALSVATDKPIHALAPKPYWNANGSPCSRRRAAGETSVSPAQKIRSLLEDAVASHLIADVPVGVFLSSGLDSTAIAALANRAQGGIHTFTVAFPDLEFSEAEKAARTAKRLGTEHRQLILSSDEMVSRLDEAVAAFDQPSMDGINTYFVSWAARQAGLKVALSGLGGDELLGGYGTFRATATLTRSATLANLVPRRFRAAAAGAAARAAIPHSSPDARKKAAAAFHNSQLLPHPYFFTRLLFTPQIAAIALRANESSWEKLAWYRWFSDAATQARSMDAFTAVSWLELRTYLANTLLRDTDCMSMSHSLEVRVPFLHAPLVEYLLSRSGTEKRDGSRPKALLVAALRDLLPEEIITQQKRTFTFPWEKWLRGPLGRRVAFGLADWSPALESHLGRDFALGVWQDFVRGRTTWSRPWSLYVLNEWVKRNLRAARPSSLDSRSVAVSSP